MTTQINKNKGWLIFLTQMRRLISPVIRPVNRVLRLRVGDAKSAAAFG
jgi:hypothetical protein